jgi:hypothetical protein
VDVREKEMNKSLVLSLVFTVGTVSHAFALNFNGSDYPANIDTYQPLVGVFSNDVRVVDYAHINGGVSMRVPLIEEISESTEPNVLQHPLVVSDDGYVFSMSKPTLFSGNSGNGELLSPVPEPATLVLFGTGLIGLAGMGRRKKKY